MKILENVSIRSGNCILPYALNLVRAINGHSGMSEAIMHSA